MSERPTLIHFSHQPSTHHDSSVSDAWHNYTCGHCEIKVTGKVVATVRGPNVVTRWLLCPNCEYGSVSSTNSEGERVLRFHINDRIADRLYC